MPVKIAMIGAGSIGFPPGKALANPVIHHLAVPTRQEEAIGKNQPGQRSAIRIF
jgi:hypothetical protein